MSRRLGMTRTHHAGAVGLGISVLLACGHRLDRSPTALRQSQLEALKTNDPAAAYALLAPEVQDGLSFKEFQTRWHDNEAERLAAIEATQSLEPALTEPLLEGTTVHHGGTVLRWAQLGSQWLVTDGLPGQPNTSTPAQTIRAFIVAVRRAELVEIRGLLGDVLLESIDEDWSARVDAIEAALDEPGAMEISAEFRRAELRYEVGKVITLEQTPQGWRIIGLR